MTRPIQVRKDGYHGNLEEAVAITLTEKWPTPTASQRMNDTDAVPSQQTIQKFQEGKINRIRKTRAATLMTKVSQTTLQDPQTHPDGSTCSVSCRRLNPLFVEYLMMGKWLIGWTDLKPLGTQSLGRQELSLSGSVSKGQES